MLSDKQLRTIFDGEQSTGFDPTYTVEDGVLAGLRAVEAAVRADALSEFAANLREWYPEDVFPKPTEENYHALNVALSRVNITLDRFSADLMRRAASQADAEAAAIRAQLTEGNTDE